MADCKKHTKQQDGCADCIIIIISVSGIVDTSFNVYRNRDK